MWWPTHCERDWLAGLATTRCGMPFGYRHSSTVGGGLLPMAVDQSHMHRLKDSYRGQAPSHIDPAPDTQCMNTAAPLWEGLAPDGGGSITYASAERQLSGASPLPH